MIRLKRITHSEMLDTPHVVVSGNNNGEAYPCKIQQNVCIDTDPNSTYWEWQDVEVVQGDADDHEVQERW